MRAKFKFKSAMKCFVNVESTFLKLCEISRRQEMQETSKNSKDSFGGVSDFKGEIISDLRCRR